LLVSCSHLSSMSSLLCTLLLAVAWAQPSRDSDDMPSSKGPKSGSSSSSSDRPSWDGNGGTDSTDVRCNYVNIGGAGMPVDYCSRIQYQGAYMAMRWKCNASYTGIDMEMYFASDCGGEPFLTQDYTAFIPGFQCSRSLSRMSCNEVSLNAFDDDECEDEDFSEIRLITDECFLYEDDHWVMMECDGDSATYSVYESRSGDCSESNLINTTRLTAGSAGKEGEEAGCIEIDGCDDSEQALEALTNHGDTSQVIGYVMASIVTLAFVAIAVVLTMRYRKRRMEAETMAAVSLSHSEKEVPNPYGQLTSVNEPSTPKAEPMLKPEDKVEVPTEATAV